MSKLESEGLWGPQALEAKRAAAKALQAQIAPIRDRWIEANRFYYDAIDRVLRFIIQPHRRVLDIRCQTGAILNAVEPAYGVGVETSPEMVAIAQGKYPHLKFMTGYPEELEMDETFDYILFQNISDTVDIINALHKLRNLCQPHTRLVIYTYNPLWEQIIKAAERLGKKIPTLEQNWLSEPDIRNMIHLCGFEWLRTYRIIALPKRIPYLSHFLNRLLPRIPLLNKLCMINVIIAKPAPVPRRGEDLSVSVVVPCKNEKGNIETAVERIPQMGRHTEILFCDDQSEDGTAEEIRRVKQNYPDRAIKLIEGPGICKAKNVWAGFRAASGDILMILDGDLTVMPEELPFFFQTIATGKGEFINGSRLVYPVPKLAMKFLNVIGNKGFSVIFSYLLDQRFKDTLCGTKVIWRHDWQRLESLVGTWGVEDRWGDYDLIFGAAKLHLQIVDLPVHYQERVYGTTKMVNVLKNGLNMMRMCLAAFIRLKMGY